MELSDTPNESQSENESSLQSFSHIIPQNLLSNSEEESKDHFIEESKEEQVLLSSAQRIQIIQEARQRGTQELEHLVYGMLFKTNSRGFSS